MGVIVGDSLLLLDLDEVLVTRIETMEDRETIVGLHPGVVEAIRPFAWHVIVLTHRSKHEASQILRLFPGLDRLLLEVVAAEDLIRGAFTTGQVFALLRGGIGKMLFLRMATRRYGVRPERIAILDDHPGNVAGVLDTGGGLGLLAPKPRIADGAVTTFDLASALVEFRTFTEHATGSAKRIELPCDRRLVLEDLPRIDVLHAKRMNGIRKLGRKLRSFVFPSNRRDFHGCI